MMNLPQVVAAFFLLLLHATRANQITTKFSVAITTSGRRTHSPPNKDLVAELLREVIIQETGITRLLHNEPPRQIQHNPRVDFVRAANQRGLDLQHDNTFRSDYHVEYGSWTGIAPLPTPKIVRELASKLDQSVSGGVVGVALLVEPGNGGNPPAYYAFPGLIPTPSP